MFIDYLTLIMINLVAGTALLAYYVYKGVEMPDRRPFAAGFGMVGIVALAVGLPLALQWPLPGSYNIAFGESTVLFGIVFLGAALALGMGWDLMPVAIYAFFAGIYAILVGLRIINLGLTKAPIPSGLGFIMAGIGGLLAAPGLRWLERYRGFRIFAAVVLVIITLFWAFTFYNSLWGHLASFMEYTPQP